MARSGGRSGRGSSSIDEVGQTNSPTVGKNFVDMLQKANDEAGEPEGPVHLLEGLRKLGYKNIAADLEKYTKKAKRSAPDADKNALWERCAYDYTLEDSGDVSSNGEMKCLYREMNRAIRNDEPSLNDWAAYVGMLMYGGDRQDFGHYRNVLAPERVRPRKPQVTYRGFAMDPALKSRYRKGRTFFWQAFVSTSKNRDTSMEFAMSSASGSNVPYLFEVTVPAYKELDFWAFELEDVSEFPEAEVLLLPYTRFKSTKDPTTDGDGVLHVYLEALDVPFVNVMNKLVVMVDPSGWTRDKNPSNAVLAKKAFLAACPKFRESRDGTLQKRSWGEYTEYGVLAGSLDGMGIFTSTTAAVKWMRGELKKKPATLFLIVVSGSASQALLDEYSSTDTVNPAQILVYCQNVPRWTEHWKHSEHVQVTGDANVAVDFCEPSKYDIKKDKFVPLRQYSITYKQGCESNMKVYYAWRQIEHGVLFAGAGSYSYYVEPGWHQAEGKLPDVHMHPYDD